MVPVRARWPPKSLIFGGPSPQMKAEGREGGNAYTEKGLPNKTPTQESSRGDWRQNARATPG